MPVKEDHTYLLLISNYIERILKFTKGMSLDDFAQSDVTYDACILNFINLGEAVKLLSLNFQKQHPEIEYKKIIGLRNAAAHSYEGLVSYVLYDTIVKNIPVLQQQVQKILENATQ